MPAMVRQHMVRITQFYRNPAHIGGTKRKKENPSVASIRKLARTHFLCHQDTYLGVKVKSNPALLHLQGLVDVFHRRLLGRHIPDAVKDS